MKYDLVIDGKKYTADYDDLDLVRDMQTLKKSIEIAADDLDLGDEDAIKAVLEPFLPEAEIIIDLTLGEGSYAAMEFTDDARTVATMQVMLSLTGEATRLHGDVLSDSVEE